MAFKLLFLFLGALSMTKEVYSGIIELDLDDVFEMNDLVRENGKVLIRKVVEDPNVLQTKNNIMQKFLIELREYSDKLETSTTKSRALEYLNFNDLVEQFKKEKVPNIGKEAETIGTSFKQNGLAEFEKTVLDHFKKFIPKFEQQVDEALKKLSNVERESEKELISFYNSFVKEEDIYKKMHIFDDFFVNKNKKP